MKAGGREGEGKPGEDACATLRPTRQRKSPRVSYSLPTHYGLVIGAVDRPFWHTLRSKGESNDLSPIGAHSKTR
ncbi:unnamed protein product [Mesocestoides corti]|uniref:Uncharacterized protein n=1 Tax=Mesocestoides corti TaxID=53468 RepID=A0A0R3UI57_MESCO|nr:unnamed protein product [Mesocestoides corti]